MSKKRRVEATPEEQEIMRRAEAKASAIDNKPTVVEEETTIVQPREKTPGITVVEASPDERTEQKTTTFTPTQVANSAILQKVLNDDNTNIASNAILDQGTKNAESIDELDETVQDAEAAKDLEEIEKNKFQENISNSTSDYLRSIGQQPSRTSYVDGTATKDKVEKDVVDAYANMDDQIPQAVIEKLGVQDYYPQAGRDVAVGNFTGSRIGSQTIYSGAGVLLPMGLYDARKRALAKAAQEKQAAVDKYFDLIDTADQYQEPFNVSLMDWMNDALYNKHKGNSDAFIKDPTVRREYARRKGLAKELTHYSTWSKGLLKDAADEKKYVTKEMVDIAGQIQSALVNNVDDVVSGKKDLGPLFAKAQVYQNIIPQIDVMVKQTLTDSTLGKMPINLRTGGVYDSEEFKSEANDFIQMAKTGNMNYNDFITGYKKFFTGDYERAIDGLIGSGKYSEEQKEAALNYFAGQMQEQVTLDHKILDSKAFDYAKLAENRRQFDLNYKRRIEEGKTHWQARNEEMNFVDKESGKNMAQIIGDFKKKGLTGSRLNSAILNVARRNGIQNATIDPYTNSVVIKELASTYENDNPKGVNNSSLWVNVKKKTIKGGKVIWKPMTIKATELPNIDLGKVNLIFQDGTKVTKDVQSQYRTAIKKNKLTMRVNSYDLSYGYADAKKNDIVTISPENISGYDPNKIAFVKKAVGKVSTLETQEKDGEIIEKYVSLPGTVYIKNEFSSKAGINSNDELWGQGLKSESGFGLGGGPVVEEYSSSSEEE